MVLQMIFQYRKTITAFSRMHSDGVEAEMVHEHVNVHGGCIWESGSERYPY